MAGTKVCFKCNFIKPLSEFYKHKQMGDGHLNKCKACSKIDARKNYIENKEHYKEYDRNRANLPHRVQARADYAETLRGKEAGAKASAKWDRDNPIKKGATTIVRNAVRDGKITKPSACSSCDNSDGMLHGHHDDYAFPLVVRWLCPQCHSDWHKENGPGLNGDEQC